MAKRGVLTVVPRLRFPEFREKSGWNAKILGDEGDFLSSLTGKTAQHFGTGSAKYVTYMNVFANTFTDMATLGIVDVENDESQNAVQVGDVLFTVSSETPDEVGMSSVVINAVPNCYVNSFCAMFRFSDGSQPNLHFLGYLLRQPFARHHFVKRAQGSTRFNLSKAAFRSLPLALPSPAEQQKIANCLTSLDEVIAAQGRRVEALKAHKRGLMQQLFPREGETRPHLRFPEFRNAPEWEVKKLGELGEVITGKTPSTTDAGLWGGDVLFITPTDIDEDGKYQGSSQRTVVATPGLKVLPAGSIAYTCIASIGKLAITVRPSITNQQINSVVTRSSVDNEFVYYALVHLTPWIKSIPATSTLPIINKTEFSGIEIWIPADIFEQKAVVDCLSSLDTQITAESNQLAALKTHKQGLMQQLFPAPEAVGA